MPPRELGRAVRAGQIEAGLLSVVDAFRAPDFELLAAMGIAVDGPAHSVLLFSSQHPSRLQGATVAVTDETSTSFRLLRLILEQRFRVSPSVFVRTSAPGITEATDGQEASLLIGDAALREASALGLVPGKRDYSSGILEMPSGARWPYVVDLAAEWKRWQGLPFVFAQWMVRRDVMASSRTKLVRVLDRSLVQSLRNLEVLAAQYAPDGGLDPVAAHAYLMGFTYRLGAAEHESIGRFRSMLEAEPWWEMARPLVLEGRDA